MSQTPVHRRAKTWRMCVQLIDDLSAAFRDRRPVGLELPILALNLRGNVAWRATFDLR